MIPNQHCCLKRQSYNDFPHIYIYIYIYVGSVFLLMTRIIGFFKPFFRYHLQDLKYSILICLEEVFFSCLLKVFSQNTCWDQLYVSFNFEVWQDIHTVSFLFCFLSFCFDLFWGYYFKGCCCKTNVCNYRGYQTLPRKCSNFLKLTAFGYINTEPMIFICSYIWKVLLLIFITLSWKSYESYFTFYFCLTFHAEFDYLWVFKIWLVIFVDYLKRR